MAITLGISHKSKQKNREAAVVSASCRKDKTIGTEAAVLDYCTCGTPKWTCLLVSVAPPIPPLLHGRSYTYSINLRSLNNCPGWKDKQSLRTVIRWTQRTELQYVGVATLSHKNKTRDPHMLTSVGSRHGDMVYGTVVHRDTT